MNASPSAQSNLASFPPPQDGTASGLQEAELVTSSYVLSNPSPAFRSAQPSQISRRRSRAVSQRNFLAIGPFLANALGSRWQAYRARIRSCQDNFSEQSVHATHFGIFAKPSASSATATSVPACAERLRRAGRALASRSSTEATWR